MAAVSSFIIGIGVAVAGAGAYMNAKATDKMASQQKAASIKAENIREQQNQLDASRRRRQAYRESILARSQAVAAGTNMGAAGAGSSGVLGGAGNAMTTGTQNQQTVTSAELMGADMFSANRAYATATAKGQQGQAWGNALTSLGGMMIQNAGTIDRLGTFGAGKMTSSKHIY